MKTDCGCGGGGEGDDDEGMLCVNETGSDRDEGNVAATLGTVCCELVVYVWCCPMYDIDVTGTLVVAGMVCVLTMPFDTVEITGT